MGKNILDFMKFFFKILKTKVMEWLQTSAHQVKDNITECQIEHDDFTDT